MSLPIIVTHGPINPLLVAETLNEVIKGRQNNHGSVTLDANVTSTDIVDTRIKLSMRVFLSPKTANAAAALTNVYVSAVTDGGFTITHANTATTNRTFEYVFVG